VLASRPKDRPMRSQAPIWIGILVGSTIGKLIPELWGEDAFSYSSLLFSDAGALVGLWIGYRISS
jgi:uncharacterized membrane protein YeaQ/YmgE (transglycosylase-associated protein family)